MRGLLRRLGVALLVFAASLAVVATASAAPAMWVVKSPTATIYLFGTMHVLQPDADWVTSQFKDAYAKSSDIWFETDVAGANDPAAMLKLIQPVAFDAAHPLSSKLDPEHLGELKALAEHDGFDFARIDAMRPWIAALVLSVAPLAKQGFDPKAGADFSITATATADHKTVRSFESLDQQLHFFADLPPAVEVQFLDNTLDEAVRGADSTASMEKAWASGDLVGLGPLLLGAMKRQYPELYEVILTRRNAAWADTLTNELTGTKTEMVNVGALHMVGDDGLPALLQARGFKVERLQ